MSVISLIKMHLKWEYFVWSRFPKDIWLKMSNIGLKKNLIMSGKGYFNFFFSKLRAFGLNWNQWYAKYTPTHIYVQSRSLAYEVKLCCSF